MLTQKTRHLNFSKDLDIENHFDVDFFSPTFIVQTKCLDHVPFCSSLAASSLPVSNVLPLFGKAQDTTDSTPKECLLWVI